ncbi:MAG: tetratricopeptide repeat protein [Streptosporangiaceae bacterium]
MGSAVPGRSGQLVDLEAERDFCLKSLRDLDAEREVGDIDEADYAALRDSYTARAAAALRALGVPADAPAPEDEPVLSLPRKVRRGGWRRTVLIVVGVALIAAGTAWALVASSATRLPGEEITGQTLAPQAEARDLQQAQVAASKGDDVTALEDYQQVLAIAPDEPEALTGEGWILAQTGQPSLLKQGLTMLAKAEKVDPGYPPAHVYRGIALLSEADYSGAVPELEWYLAHNPDPTLAPRVRQALSEAQAQAARSAGHPAGG